MLEKEKEAKELYEEYKEAFSGNKSTLAIKSTSDMAELIFLEANEDYDYYYQGKKIEKKRNEDNCPMPMERCRCITFGIPQ